MEKICPFYTTFLGNVIYFRIYFWIREIFLTFKAFTFLYGGFGRFTGDFMKIIKKEHLLTCCFPNSFQENQAFSSCFRYQISIAALPVEVTTVHGRVPFSEYFRLSLVRRSLH